MRAQDDASTSLDELRRFYADVDAAYAGTSCPATTECCRFGRTGREPYVTSVELALVRRAIARRGGGRPARPKPLHETRVGLAIVSDERVCPMLGPEGKCAVYEDRPFGCRTYFCDRATRLSEVKHKEMLAFVARLKGIAVRHSGDSDGRPLTRWLAEKGSGRTALNNSRARPSKGSRGPSSDG